jgi:hypothetical protein
MSLDLEGPVLAQAVEAWCRWCRDVTVEVADEVRRRIIEQDTISEALLGFLDENWR